MPQTDRQTDKKAKSTWWSVTAFNGEIEIMEDKEHYPEWVTRVYGGREVCPDTGRLHFQGAIQCATQVRLSQFKQWLPTAHLEAARSADALKKYAMKPETAVGPKEVHETTQVFLKAYEICQLIGDQLEESEFFSDTSYWTAVIRILTKNKCLTSQLMNPSLRNFWLNTRYVWQSKKNLHSITEDSPQNLCGCGKDECMQCYEWEVQTGETMYVDANLKSPRRL